MSVVREGKGLRWLGVIRGTSPGFPSMDIDSLAVGILRKRGNCCEHERKTGDFFCTWSFREI